MAWQWKPAIKKLHQQFPVGFCLNHNGNFKGKPRTTRHVMTLYQNNFWISHFFFTFFKGYRCNQFAVITRNKISHESPRLLLDQTDTRKAERKFFGTTSAHLRVGMIVIPLLLCSYILIGNCVRIKSSGMARGLANARPPGSAKFANAPPPELTRRANAPQ